MSVLDQWANAVPPRKGAEVTIAVDSTGRAYNISKLALGGYTPNGENVRSVYCNLQLTADGGDVYIQFDSTNTVTLDDTAAHAAGTELVVFANTYCAKIPSGATVPVRIDRKIDKYMHIKTSTGTAKLRFHAFSGSE